MDEQADRQAGRQAGSQLGRLPCVCRRPYVAHGARACPQPLVRSSILGSNQSLHMADNTVAFDSQVGGHPGLRVDADGSRIIKPCLPAERHFYETVINADAEEFKLLSKHVPTFYGVTPAVADEKDESRFPP